MKHAIKTTKIITIALLTLCVMGTTQSAFATVKPTSDFLTEITFLGKVKNSPLFQLNMNNVADGAYRIVIKNANDVEIYSEWISGVNISRKYQLNISEEDLNDPQFELNFEVTSLKTNQKQNYKVSQKTKVLQGFEVVKS